MGLQILPEQAASYASLNQKDAIGIIRNECNETGVEEALLFYNFPLFREDENLLVAEFVFVSPIHGVILISTADSLPSLDESAQQTLDQLEGAFNQVFSKLVKYPRLRRARATLQFNLDAWLWIPRITVVNGEEENILAGVQGLKDALVRCRETHPLNNDTFSEVVSVLDGSKALIRSKERPTKGLAVTAKVQIINSLEEEIRKFDRDQRVAYMTSVVGVQRVRGLAGSGKTVVLAMKAAITAIREPDAQIAVTFYTKSLYQHIKQLITRFYRLYEDRDPNWKKIQILHAWGGETAAGLYYVAAKRLGSTPLNYAQARQISPQNPFGFACNKLMRDHVVEPLYDYIFVDEAQDFSPEFMRLALALARDENLVVAYDVFQTIFDVEVPTAKTLFGQNGGISEISFSEDVILRKCYRNPREILVCAHAIGFGLYGPRIVQMLESEDHWNDFGYEVVSGELNGGEQVVISRPEQNSPSSISTSQTIDEILNVSVFADFDAEVNHVAAAIKADIFENGVPPEDIVVISADDKNGAAYYTYLRKLLLNFGVLVNNLQDDFGIRDFQSEGHVTFATIYKAKGNEAYCVYLVGIDALFLRSSPKNRNKAFTAMTRAKGWLSVSGIGEAAQRFANEVNIAKSFYPNLCFEYPRKETLVYMKRDLVGATVSDVDDQISRLADDMSVEELEVFLRRKLRELKNANSAKKGR